MNVATRLGFSGPAVEVPDARRDRWWLPDDWRLFHCGSRCGVELLWSTGPEAKRHALRRWVLRLARRTGRRHFLHVHDWDGTTRLAAHRPGPARLREVVSRRLDDALWAELSEVDDDHPDRFALRLTDVLDRDDLTRRFFKRFRHHLGALEGQWTGDLDEFERHDLTMALLCRLMFVTFIAQTRGLAGRRDYLRWLLDQPRAGDMYRDALRPLFFSALNCPEERRPASAGALGALPFLNGGLFHPLAVESDPHLTLPDAPLGEAVYELFEKYRFCADRTNSRGAIDPEMLGHVFEGLMLAGERRVSGSFYTPAGLVREFVNDLLAGAVVELGPWASAWVRGTLDGRPVVLDEAGRALLDDRLVALRILDPAVGSGAFLLGALDALTALRTALRPDVSPFALRREVLTSTLYGVDLKMGAVRLCELRLWLSLMAEADPIAPLEPLPNLDHHVRQGDSLAEPLFDRARQAGLVVADGPDYARLHGPDKDAEGSRLRLAELERLTSLVDSEIAREQGADPTDQADLFGRGDARAKAPSERLQSLLAAKRGLDRGELPYFSYTAAFPEVMAAGGFDCIVGNPPWIRLHDVPPERRRELKRRFATCRGRGSGFSQQVDLSVPFIERSLELTRPGGQVGLLVPAKLFKAQYGRTLRRRLREGVSIARFEDLSHQSQSVFRAANYPCWVGLRNHPPRHDAVTKVGRAGTTDSLSAVPIRQTDLSISPNPDAPWCALPPATREFVRRLRGDHVSLAEYGLRARLGLKTGCNPVFVAKRWHPQGPDAMRLDMAEGTLVVPNHWAPEVLRGRDLSAFTASPSTRAVIAYDRETLRPEKVVPDSLAQYFGRFERPLRQRADAGRGPAWKVFRTSVLRPAHRVVWRDIAPRLEATYLRPEQSLIPLNTCYVFEVADETEGLLIAALLNSFWLRLLAAVAAEPALNGYQRLLGWTVEGLPWPGRLRPGSRDAEILVKLARSAHEEWTPEVQLAIDTRVGRLLGVAIDEQANFRAQAGAHFTKLR